MSELKFYSFTSNKEDGNMSISHNFYEENISYKERKLMVSENKQKVADRLAISYKDIFIPVQKRGSDNSYRDGHTLELKEDEILKYDDLYDYDYKCDIVKLTKETPYIATGYQVADSPVVAAVNMKTEEAAIARCGVEEINRYLPMQLIDRLGGNERDILVHVLPLAHILTYKDGELKWILNKKIWEDAIIRSVNSLKINQLYALKKMLFERYIKKENLYVYPFDTVTDRDYYSKSNTNDGINEDNGRFISGIILTDQITIPELAKVFSKKM